MSKECETLYGQLEIIKKDAALYQNQLDNDTNFEVIKDLRSELAIKDKLIIDLQSEIKSMEKIQKQQGLHLEKLNEKTDYTKKIKSLGEENRAQNDRICMYTLHFNFHINFSNS